MLYSNLSQPNSFCSAQGCAHLPVDEIQKQTALPVKDSVSLEERCDFVCDLGNQLVTAEEYFHINGINTTSLC